MSKQSLQVKKNTLPPLTTEDQVPPEELLLAGGVAETSPGGLWEPKSTAVETELIRDGGTLWARGVRWDLGDILGGPVNKGPEKRQTGIKYKLICVNVNPDVNITSNNKDMRVSKEQSFMWQKHHIKPFKAQISEVGDEKINQWKGAEEGRKKNFL